MKLSIQELLAKARAAKAAREITTQHETQQEPVVQQEPAVTSTPTPFQLTMQERLREAAKRYEESKSKLSENTGATPSTRLTELDSTEVTQNRIVSSNTITETGGQGDKYDEVPRVTGDSISTEVDSLAQLPALAPPAPAPRVQFADDIVLNAKQQEFKDLVLSGKDCVLIGAAGTGKTTCLKAVIQALAMLPTATTLQGGHKYLLNDTPSTILTSFTRRAVNNLKRAVSSDFKSNCVTLHKLLEYQPEYYEVLDPETGDYKNTMRFCASRNQFNTLDASIKCIGIDESSMVSLELEEELNLALPHRVQRFYLGDINQLPPVFGSAVLGYRMQELPVVELTEIYRQAANSPIIKYATAIKEGQVFSFKEKHTEVTEDGKITFHPWKKKISAEDALSTSALFLKKAYDLGAYDPEEDIILCPFNKSFGTLELNKHVANHIARKKGSITHEVIAGFMHHYFSVGDKVLYDKEEAYITAIAKNGAYKGTKKPKQASTTLDYWGCEQAIADPTAFKLEATSPAEEDYITEDEVEKMLAAMTTPDDEERVTAASHIITLQLQDSEAELAIDSASAINGMLLGYALTVHKSQGSEWNKVFVMLHQSHATMLQRELLYTAITRARNECYIICEPDTFTKGVISQRIKGNTLAEKAEYFKGKYIK